MTPDQELTDLLSECYADPLKYVMLAFPWDTDPIIQQVELAPEYQDRFNCEYGPDKWACQFLDSLGADIAERDFNGRDSVRPIRYSTASGHGIGKSTLVAWLIKFIMDTRPFAKGVVTANTSDQLRTKTWAELGKWHNLSITKHLFDYTSGRGSMALSRVGAKENWKCDALTWREENTEGFQGLHAANSTPFFIFDEASGIPDVIWEARAGGATDGEPMSFDFGNPTRNSGMFYENCIGRYRHRHTVRSIDSRDVEITNKALFEEWREDRGEDSDFFKVKVRGVFPSAGSIQFISREAVDGAMRRDVPGDIHAPLIIGVDVARFGENDSVIYPRLGYDARSFPIKRFNGLDTVQLVGQIIGTIKEFEALGKKCSALFVDGGGIGGAVVDQLRHLGYAPLEVQAGGKPTDQVYRLKGDEMWGNMREALSKLALPDDPELAAQMTQREYSFTPTGKLELESKKDMKKRGVPSPDTVDALAITFAADPSIIVQGMPTHIQVKSEYNPLEQDW